MTSPGACQNCGATVPRRALFSRTDLERCDRCGGWSYVGAVTQAIEDLYGEAYFTGGEYADYARAARSHALNFRRKLVLLERHGLGDLGRVRMLEIGCATGEFMKVAAEAGVPRMLGLEPSAYCRAIAARRNLDVLAPGGADAADAVRALRPNLVVAWDVWEHLSAPASVLDGILREAAPAVLVALTTVDAGSAVARLRRTRWRQFHPPTHLHYPTRRSIRDYLRARGFAIRHHGAFGYYRPLYEYLKAIGVRVGPAASFERPVYVNLHDIQIAIARRERS